MLQQLLDTEFVPSLIYSVSKNYCGHGNTRQIFTSLYFQGHELVSMQDISTWDIAHGAAIHNCLTELELSLVSPGAMSGH